MKPGNLSVAIFLAIVFTAHLVADESQENLRIAAERGDAVAAYNLGIAYLGGNGLEKDHTQGAMWITKAADQGLAEAQDALGIMYLSGTGVEKDAIKAAEWIRKAAVQGNVRALAPVIEHYDKVIAEEYSKAPGHEVIDSLPGAGPAMAPRLWVACVQAGTDSAAVNLAQASGIAQVQRQSGRARSICFRRARSLFLHQSWLESAYHSLAGSSWARAFYKKRKAAGHGNNAVLRALAFKWIRIVARLWHDKVPYDEAYYLEHLKNRPALT